MHAFAHPMDFLDTLGTSDRTVSKEDTAVGQCTPYFPEAVVVASTISSDEDEQR